MNRMVLAVLAAALFACGGKEVKFNLSSPPRWLKNLDDALPAKALTRSELEGDCLGTQQSPCELTVRRSRTMTRKAKFELRPGSGDEVRITYVPREEANSVTVTLRSDKPATVPVRKSGGIIVLRCVSIQPCIVDLM